MRVTLWTSSSISSQRGFEVFLILDSFRLKVPKVTERGYFPYIKTCLVNTCSMTNCFNSWQDLHRTGCSGFNGQDNEEDRAVLKRVLLAYARWNKQVGYCQGFNVIAALILDVMDRKEDDALKVINERSLQCWFWLVIFNRSQFQ